MEMCCGHHAHRLLEELPHQLGSRGINLCFWLERLSQGKCATLKKQCGTIMRLAVFDIKLTFILKEGGYYYKKITSNHYGSDFQPFIIHYVSITTPQSHCLSCVISIMVP